MSEDRCTYSIDGEHHYGVRKWLVGKDANEKGNWQTVIACRCKKRPDNEHLVKEQLAATARERARQAELSRAQVRAINTYQPKLDL